MSDYFSATVTLTHGTPALVVDASTKDRMVYLAFPLRNSPDTTVGYSGASLIPIWAFLSGGFMLPAGEQIWADGATGNTVTPFVTKSPSSISLCG